MSLLDAHNTYIQQVIKANGNVITYNCPTCANPIDTAAPAAGSEGTWDSLTTCPHCYQMHMKRVTADEASAVVPSVEDDQ